MLLLLLFATSTLPNDQIVEDNSSLIERNHFHDENGQPVFTQLIFWHWDVDHHTVMAWRIVRKNVGTVQRYRDGWMVILYDRNRIRRVRAGLYRETWTQHDPELADRAKVPTNQRRGLTSLQTLD